MTIDTQHGEAVDGGPSGGGELGVIAGLATRLTPLHNLLLRIDGRREARDS